ncbi:hypothetical protein ASC89_20530 [Devosia sp. Root413D1]|uniref:RICIN domain-containing protein n=1 Tax=unclassified Devosia TaxID=196773 RepID=UPI0006F37EC1|nr:MULTISPECIES: RICIN domain-containing protein [unclassified Devosia]KQU97661.1 hypothetical protein ASC68_12820 [Devosia sp. Root105]KQW77557.1 hypothetical protein ASC89_20530 [Devosia sp. Root413D1]
MPTFEFADCPTTLTLATAPDTQEQTGSVRCTLRNTSARRQSVRIRIEPLGNAQSKWFGFAGAPTTSPLELEQEIDAGGTFTVTAGVKVPPGAPVGPQSFRLRAIAESAPDTDFAEGPAISFEVAASKGPDKPASAFPWWAVAVAAAMVLVVGAGLFFMLQPKSDPDPQRDPATGGLNGKVMLLTNLQTQKCLTIKDGSAENNIFAVQMSCADEPLKRWLFTEVQPTHFQIKNVQTGKCLTISGGESNANNLEWLQYNCDDHRSRTWTTSGPSADGTYQLINVHTNKCLTIAGGRSTDDGVVAVQYDCDTDPSRRWKLVPAQT